MAAPRGKGFYERQASAYRGGDSIQFAQDIGASFIVLHGSLVNPQKVSRAHAAGLSIWFWTGPTSWNPDNWRRTYANQMTLSGRYASQGALGFIPDIEELSWQDVEQSERNDLYAALRVASETYPSIGFTSYPSWPYHDEIARAAPLIWASPQLYGIISPGSGAELRRRGQRWRNVFQGGYCPSLAAWDRTSDIQAAYLQDFIQEEGAIFWHNRPAFSGVTKQVITAFTLVGEEPRDRTSLAQTDRRLGTQLSTIEASVASASSGYANRRRQAQQRLSQFITVPDVIGTGAVAAAGTGGRDRVAAIDRADRMQASTRADMYAAAETAVGTVVNTMARASGLMQMTTVRAQQLATVQDALGFDFATGEWTQQTSPNQAAGTDVGPALAVRDGSSGPNDPGPSGIGV